MVRHNYLAIIVMIIAHMLIGFLWYGVIFSETWSLGAWGKTPEEIQAGGDMSAMPYVVNVIAAACATIFLSWLVQKLNANTFGEGLMIGLYVSIGIVFPAIAVHYMFLPMSAEVLFIDLAMTVLTTLLTAGVLAAWRKREVVVTQPQV